MVGPLVRVVKRWPTLTAFTVVFLAGVVAWGYDQRLSNARVAERRRDVTTVCMFINDTRAELRGIVRDYTDTPANPSSQLPPAVAKVLDDMRAQAIERSRRAEARLVDYECDAFLRGEVPNRGPGDPPQR